MYNFSQDLSNKLASFNQRKLTKGEVFLLAKAIADEIPLMPADEENVKIYILNHKRFIDDVIWTLNGYTFIGDNEAETLLKLIGDLTLWRSNVAYNPPTVLFRDCPNSVIDDISSLPRYVDITYMCSVGDIISTANYMFGIFKSFVKEVKSKMVTDGSSDPVQGA